MGKMVFILLALASMGLAGAEVQVTELRCENRINPVGLDTPAPRFNWILASDGFGQTQSAYQVLVASDEQRLAAGQADMWDSGKVLSDQSVNVVYAGKRLESLRNYYWKVRVWDGLGSESPWSQSGRWLTGWMAPDSFPGQWITYAKPSDHETYQAGPPMDFKGAKWLWYPGENATKETGAARLKFSRSFEVDSITALKSARIVITVDNAFNLMVNGKPVGTSTNWESARVFDLKPFLAGGGNLIEVEAENLDASPAGLIAKLEFEDAKGKSTLVTDKNWQVVKLAGGDTSPQPAQENANAGAGPWGQVAVEGLDTFWTQDAPSPMLRKEFALKGGIKSAYVTIAGLGFYELRINGGKVGDKVLDPVITNYTKRVLYSTYDVTSQLNQGANAIGIQLANGWYNSHTRAAWNYNRAPWRDRPKVLMALIVNYADGSTETIATDTGWQGANGPLVADAIRSGEVYDARLERAGWDRTGCDTAGWEPVKPASAPQGRLVAEMMPGTKVLETIRPIAVTEPEKGVYLFDIGDNIAGWARLTVSGTPGQKITLRYGEVVRDGKLNTDNIRGLTYSGPFQTDTYYLKGTGIEQWHPSFVYHGFRYVEVKGLTAPPTLDTIVAQVVHTDFESAGRFECSNAMFNAIQAATRRSYLSNFVGIPTDCPQREKNGWTADAHLAAELAMLNYNNVPAYEKWLHDFSDDQDSQGRYSCIIPSPGWGARDLTEWDSAYMIIPWYLYLYRDDLKAVADNYDAMKRYIANVRGRIEKSGYIVEFGLGDWANDGGSVTPVPLTATAYFYYDAVLMARFAALLNKPAESRDFVTLAEKVKTAYNGRFYHGDGIYAAGEQTALAMSLFYGLVPEPEKPKVLAQLVKAIEAKGNHHDTGILGAKCIFRVLSDLGRTDLAMTMLTQTTEPSYGYWLANGATTLYENWSNSPGSMNHIMYGDVSAWFYSYLGGIQADPARPGFKHFFIKPEFAEGIDWVKAEHDSSYGPVKVDWEIAGDRFKCSVEVPVNTQATVMLTTRAPESVKVTGQGCRYLDTQNGRAVYQAGSGHFEFTGLKQESPVARQDGQTCFAHAVDLIWD